MSINKTFKMSTVKDRSSAISHDFYVPEQKIVSEGDKLIKDLVQKQLCNHVELQDELNRTKDFQSSTELVSITSFTSGATDLSSFQKCTEFVDNLEKLKSYGLTEDEIELYLDHKKGDSYVADKHKNICKTVLQDQLNQIRKKIENANYEMDQTNETTAVSRHVKEIGLCVKPESVETKLYNFASSCSSTAKEDVRPLEHPINQLSQLERELFAHLDQQPIPSLKKRRKKARKYLDKVKVTFNCNSNACKNLKFSTNWDVEHVHHEKQIEIKVPKKFTCKPQQFYTIKDNEIVKLNSSNVNDIDVSSRIKCNGKPFVAGQQNQEKTEIVVKEKLSEEEIRALPKFQNYEKGEPTNILFLKNLANNVNEEDLINLFNSFDNENQKITYRLLGGKMTGQAFVTFNSTSRATDALEALNGCVIKNKPVVIQYGKNRNKT